MTNRIVVFAKTPRPGRVKTRLCPPLTPRQSAALARAFLVDVLELCESLPDYERLLAYTPRGTRAQMAALAGGRWRLSLQKGDDLGERLANAFADAFSAARGRVLIIGTDSPHLPSDTLRAADAALAKADMVLGPSEDGGYYLIGLRRWAPGLLGGVRWSTEYALEDTLAGAERLGLRCRLLDREYDIDQFGDLVRLVADQAKLPADRLRHTRRALAAVPVTGLAREPERSGRVP